MDRLDAMQLFVRVAELGSFAAAAQQTGVARSAVTRQIAGLEAHLGIKLMARSTRRLALTSAGTAYLEKCRVILNLVEAAETGVAEERQTPRGSIRISLPLSYGLKRLAPLLLGVCVFYLGAAIGVRLLSKPTAQGRNFDPQWVATIAVDVIVFSTLHTLQGGNINYTPLFAMPVLLILVVFLGDWVKQIPMAALVAVMIMVSIGTFNWGSFKNLREHPKSSSVVMLATVAVTVYTHDLARGVLTGVLLSGFFFAHKIAQILLIEAQTEDDGETRSYAIYGQVFFASADRFVDAFDFDASPRRVRIDLTHAHFWDITAVNALDKVVLKFRRKGAEVEVLGLNEASATLVDRFGVHDKDIADGILMGH